MKKFLIAMLLVTIYPAVSSACIGGMVQRHRARVATKFTQRHTVSFQQTVPCTPVTPPKTLVVPQVMPPAPPKISYQLAPISTGTFRQVTRTRATGVGTGCINGNCPIK